MVDVHPGSSGHAAVDVAVIGGGQAALATAYYPRRAGLSFVVLDDQDAPGGAWRHGWKSLKLFSPAAWSSLSGWPMPAGSTGYPGCNDVVDYLTRYEARYELPVVRPVMVESVVRSDGHFLILAQRQQWRARAVVSATGTWGNPFIPSYAGAQNFAGEQLHSAHYVDAAPLSGRKILVVGGGNSGAQILAEVSMVADTLWVTQEPPAFLPDNVDGRVLFERASARWKALQEGRTVESPVGGLGYIVMVDSVVEARGRGVLKARRPFLRFTMSGVEWEDGSSASVDAVIWCTGFRPALAHLRELGIVGDDGRVQVVQTRSVLEPRLWLVGYGEWTGAASATLIGVNRTARSTVSEIANELRDA